MPNPVFDGHNDFLLRLLRAPERREQIWLKGDGEGHLDLPRMRRAGFAGGFFAIYIPSPEAHDSPDFEALMDAPPYDLPLPELIGHEAAQPVALAMAGHLLWMERAAKGAFKVCRSAAEVRACVASGTIAAIMHMEGAEPIDPDLTALYALHAMGLRSIGPVWSRPTEFGHGVPFRYPGSPDTGPGLTDAGKALVRACNDLGIMLDLSHLNEAGFNDVAALSTAPLIATHSNAHAITPSTRNLTDRQLAMIAESNGIVGLNFATVFLRPDGRKSPEMTLEPVLRHLDHLISKLGEDRVGFGSDFDGATTPREIGDVMGLLPLQAALEQHGFNANLMRKLTHENWLAALDRSLISRPA
ncbi:MAG: peptidase [Alphaproteobacteria bacterium HGW-Alphaproteobacteria-4]|nr:MAG: peptidase [Alphaproteobacteria bacterium HGW-Alphaproteobacteria-4]